MCHEACIRKIELKNNMKDKISNYWTNRTSKKGFFHKLKKNYLLQVLFSVRAGDELFLTRELNKNKRGKILDLACGGGEGVFSCLFYSMCRC